MKNVIAGAFLGIFAGALGVIVHGGFLAFPPAGLVLAGFLVASGAWFTAESFKVAGWVTYVFAASIISGILLVTPFGGDVFVSPVGWLSQTWLVLGALSAIVPGIRIVSSYRHTS